MKVTFEVSGYRNDKKLVFYKTVELYPGKMKLIPVTNEIVRKMKRLGYTDINVHLM